MIPLLAALLLRSQDKPVLPALTPAVVSNDVRDWEGFKHLSAGPRKFPLAFRSSGDWSNVKTAPAASALVWRTKVVILDRVDRAHEQGPGFVWPGHHSLAPDVVARVRRALPQFRALVAQGTGGAVDLVFDVAEEAEPVSIEGGDLAKVVARYLEPRLNGGRYDAEDGAFRGPYASVLVVHPVGGEAVPTFEVQGASVDLFGLPEYYGGGVDGAMAEWMYARWMGQVALRARELGYRQGDASDPEAFYGMAPALWGAAAAGRDATTEQRLQLLSARPASEPKIPALVEPASGERGAETALRIAKDPERGNVLVMEESGPYRAGGFALPTPPNGPTIPDVKATPTLAFWAKSDARDPIVVRLFGDRTQRGFRLGTDVPFVYDNAWHRVKLDMRAEGMATKIDLIKVSPDTEESKLRLTLGPIVASFSDFEATAEAPDAAPQMEAPSPTAVTPEARAAWVVGAPPGDARRRLMKDPNEAVRANAVAAALAVPDPADEQILVESALFTFEPTIYTPALRALGNSKTPLAGETLRRALRSAAADRARGLAAEILAEGGDPKFVPFFIGLNQARSRGARLAAVRALGRLPGPEAARMRMAFLPQDDPEIKLAATLTADANDDYQGRKLLWSAINEPSDAVRLESLRRLSYSTIPEFKADGVKGVRDDSVGVRVGLLEAWAAAPRPEFLPSIRVALRDQAPRVRAAALDALGGAGTPDAKEVPFDDPDPLVQLAILRLAKSKGLAVPEEARERYRKSPDPKVRAAAG